MLLITLLLIKHFLADFVFQSGSMAAGKGQLKDWFDWLAFHCAIHCFLTTIILMFFAPNLALAFGLIDFGIHFIVDRIKADPRLGGRWKPDQHAFWNALGADQLAHGLTYVAIAAMVAR